MPAKPAELKHGRVALSRLRPAPWNPRTIKDPRFQNLCKSIEADPGLLDLRPILATLDGTIYGGNQRFRAVKHLGWDSVPAVLSDIPDQLAKERAMRDNGTWGEWQDDDLGTLLAELKTAGTDLDLLGFDSAELDRLLGSVTQLPEEDEADLEPPSEPITKPGDLWLLGEHHRVLCADSSEPAQLARLLDKRKVQMVLTDPPYGMDLNTDWSSITGALGSLGAAKGTTGNRYERVIGDDAPFDPGFLLSEFAYCAEIFLFGADYYAERITNRGSGSWLVWDKRKESQEDAIGAEFELLWSKARHKRRVLRHDWFGFLSSANSSEAHNRVHPTQKPTSLLRDIMEQWGKPRDLVLDLFGGSGSTLIAAEQTSRTAYLMEIDARYVQVILERWAKLTGRDPVRDDGVTWSALRARSAAPTLASTH